MNYPLQALLTGLRTAILSKLTTARVETVPQKEDTVYPYIWLSQPFMIENGPKGKYIYEIEILIQVIHKDLASLTPLLTQMQAIHEILNNGAAFAVSGYTMLAAELVNTNQTVEMLDTGRLDIGLIRCKFELK